MERVIRDQKGEEAAAVNEAVLTRRRVVDLAEVRTCSSLDTSSSPCIPLCSGSVDWAGRVWYTGPMRRTASLLLAVSVGVFGSRSLWADTLVKIAVMDVHTTDVDPKYKPLLTDVVTTEVDALGGHEVLSSRDIEAVLGFEQQKQLVGCEDAECLANIGGALGVDLLLVPRVGKLGGQYVVSINLVDTREVRSVGRVYETVSGDLDVLVTTIKASIHQLFTSGTHAGGEPSGASTWIAPVALWIAGGVGLATGATFGIMARSHAIHANDPAHDGGQLEIDKARTSQIAANVAYGVGAACALAGGAVWYLGRRSAAPPAVSVSAGPAGAQGFGVFVSGPLP